MGIWIDGTAMTVAEPLTHMHTVNSILSRRIWKRTLEMVILHKRCLCEDTSGNLQMLHKSSIYTATPNHSYAQCEGMTMSGHSRLRHLGDLTRLHLRALRAPILTH